MPYDKAPSPGKQREKREKKRKKKKRKKNKREVLAFSFQSSSPISTLKFRTRDIHTASEWLADPDRITARSARSKPRSDMPKTNLNKGSTLLTSFRGGRSAVTLPITLSILEAGLFGDFNRSHHPPIQGSTSVFH